MSNQDADSQQDNNALSEKTARDDHSRIIGLARKIQSRAATAIMTSSALLFLIVAIIAARVPEGPGQHVLLATHDIIGTSTSVTASLKYDETFRDQFSEALAKVIKKDKIKPTFAIAFLKSLEVNDNKEVDTLFGAFSQHMQTRHSLYGSSIIRLGFLDAELLPDCRDETNREKFWC